MKIEDFNPYGLYKNNILRKYIPSLKSDDYDDQTQGWWLPFYDKDGNIHLVDTYHIDSPSLKNEETLIEKLVRQADEKYDNSWLIGNSNFRYYYGGSVKVTPSSLQYFDLVCDLRDMETTRCSEDYNPDDVVKQVQFYFEQNYSRGGIDLVKKNAKKNKDIMCDNLIFKIMYDQNHFTLPLNYLPNELEKYIASNEISEVMKQKAQITLNTLLELKKLYEQYTEIMYKYRNTIRNLEGEN